MPQIAPNIAPLELRNLHNDFISLEMLRNRLEHDRLILLKYDGDPIIDDTELYNLNLLQSEILCLKKILHLMEMKLGKMRSASCQELNCPSKFE